MKAEAHQQVQARPLAALVREIKATLSQIPAGWVEVEVERVSEAGGHLWLQLAGGEDARVEAVIWRSSKGQALAALPAPLKRGDKVAVRYDRVDFYGPRGDLRLFISRVLPVGEGELLRRRQEVIGGLRADGLCGRRRQLPAVPRRIGVVAAADSEALHDVLTAVQRRFPPARLVHVPARVQGAAAPGDLIRAVLTLEAAPDVDVIVVARGGGSVADLVAFDDEELCRIIAGCSTPVVAAVGHTRNWPACNEVAAAAAEVPAAVAERVVPSAADLLLHLDQQLASLTRAGGSVTQALEHLERAAGRTCRAVSLENLRHGLDRRAAQLDRCVDQFHARNQRSLDRARAAVRLACERAPGTEALDRARRAVDRALAEAVAQQEPRIEQARRSVEAALHAVPDADALAPHRVSVARALAQLPAPAALEPTKGRIVHVLGRARREAQLAADASARAGTRAGRAAGVARDRREDAVSSLATRRSQAAARRSAECEQQLSQLAARARAHDPSARGYALLRDAAGRIVAGARGLASGEAVAVEFSDGYADAHINSIHLHKEEKA